jgi:tetratricopeptide (TPR) repeat protein
LCAFLAPEELPRPLLSDHADQLPDRLQQTASDQFAFDQTLGALGGYSLLTVTEHTLVVHRLVQTVVRQDLDEAAARSWAGAAVRLVLAAFPVDSHDVRSWPVCARLLPHALTAAEHAAQLGAELRATGGLLNRAAGYLWARAELAQAQQLFERALVIIEAELGPDHPEVATILNNLGLVLRDLGDLPAARDHYQRALTIYEGQAERGPGHPHTATTLTNLGAALRGLGDVPAARTLLERALAIWEAQLGSDHVITVTARQHLAAVLDELGLPAEPAGD